MVVEVVHLPALDCLALELLQESVLHTLAVLYSVVAVPSQREQLPSFNPEPVASH